MSTSIHIITRPRAVTFSQYSSLALISKDDMKSKWYSAEEKQEIRQALIRDVRHMSKELDCTDAIGAEQLYQCVVGIENCMTHGLARHVAKKRREHTDAILAEQCLQAETGVCDPEKLSSISKKQSRWSRNRAHKLALGYGALLHE